jgi:hypothetical protein
MLPKPDKADTVKAPSMPMGPMSGQFSSIIE